MVKSWRPQWSYKAINTNLTDFEHKLPLVKESSEEELLSKFQNLQQRCTRLRRIAITLSLAVFVAILVAAITIVVTKPSKGHRKDWHPEDFHGDVHVTSPTKASDRVHHCGNSSAQARELGCKFHQLTWSWLPPECPSYANELFMNAPDRPWVYYEDIEAKAVVDEASWEEVLNGERKVFVQQREHSTHCVFMLLSIAQIVRDRTSYHEKMVKYEHMEHCAYMLLDILKTSKGWNDMDTLSGTVAFDQYCEQSNLHPK
jgi:hypothetical protein